MSGPSDACRARNRRAALRGGISAAPVVLGAGVGLAQDEALDRINALRVGGAPLTGQDVHIRYAEAANGSYIPSRALFLAESTLRNVAEGANHGVSFMNSHRTGGFSTPSELPFGQTFWGRFNGAEAEIGVWMLRGVKPNGENGPSTDDLAAMIDAGALKDVSVGLYGGQPICDLCGLVVNEWDENACGHVPGTTHAMSPAEQEKQKRRGVPDGCATYSLHDARFGEVSAVFDGAVPGAGFRKAVSFAARGDLTPAELGQCRAAYVALARDHDFGPIGPAEIQQLARALEALWQDPEDEPLAGTFAAHSQSVLAAVTEYVKRAEGYAALRAGDARLPSPVRREEWAQLHARLGRLITPAADGQARQALQARQLQRQARRRDAGRAGVTA